MRLLKNEVPIKWGGREGKIRLIDVLSVDQSSL